MNKIKTYFDEVVKEMRKVNWPKRSELIDNTVLTLLGTVVIGIFIFATDWVIRSVMSILYV